MKMPIPLHQTSERLLAAQLCQLSLHPGTGYPRVGHRGPGVAQSQPLTPGSRPRLLHLFGLRREAASPSEGPPEM